MKRLTRSDKDLIYKTLESNPKVQSLVLNEIDRLEDLVQQYESTIKQMSVLVNSEMDY